MQEGERATSIPAHTRSHTQTQHKTHAHTRRRYSEAGATPSDGCLLNTPTISKPLAEAGHSYCPTFPMTSPAWPVLPVLGGR